MREYKIGDKIIYPLGANITPESKIRGGKIVGYGRYDDIYLIEDETGIITLRLDAKYKNWLKSYYETHVTDRKCKNKKYTTRKK